MLSNYSEDIYFPVNWTMKETLLPSGGFDTLGVLILII